jgi:hypothetical protein
VGDLGSVPRGSGNQRESPTNTQRRGAGAALHHFREERIPDHPRINRPALESGAGVRRRQIDRGDLKGKRVGLNKGSDVNYLLVAALEKAGLSYKDIYS